jgi:hypothetical protein
MNTIIVLSHLGLGDNLFNIPLVNYLSKTNLVELVCKTNNAKNIAYFFKDNENVSLLIVDTDSNISPKMGYSIEKYNDLIKNKTVLASGYHIENSNINSFPFFMYDDIKMDLKIFKENFNPINTDKSTFLYNIIKKYQYIFLCNDSSNGELFNINEFLNKYNINMNTTIIICPTKNMYDLNHPFYNIAQQFLYKSNDLLILDYKEVIENSLMNVLSDSSLFCFTIQLKLTSKNNFLFTRCQHKRFNWNRLINFFEQKFTIIISCKHIYICI